LFKLIILLIGWNISLWSSVRATTPWVFHPRDANRSGTLSVTGYTFRPSQWVSRRFKSKVS